EMQLRNYSSKTVNSYSSLLSKIESFYHLPFDQISTQQLKDYVLQRISSEGISTSMINQYISAFKIMQVDVLKRNWEQIQIKRPRRVKRLPVVLSIDEVEKLIAATRNLKHRAIIMLAYSSGLRRQEIQQIKPSAIDSSRMQVHVVQGKGKKDRYTILSPKALEVLRLYYKYERPSCFLFEPQGKKGKQLADVTLNCIVKKLAAKAGIKKRISFHTLRHCFATHLLEKGVNLKLIQQLLGHVSIKTTSGYLHLANVNPASVISPLDSMNF
ncbi:tyrosine-type recombinase/integrase, partial [Lacibacter sp.]|uniref:tyrosine-type recombinase/integrase n=1 Tax=Lacibacter sp. TaxID=1915409 RepID=UPI002B4B4C04